MSDTGNVGEKLFSLWCSQSNITCNKSDEDKAGWDFRLDFSTDNSRQLKEIHKAAAHCLVQVKATRSKRIRIRIKLSNLERYITTLEPVFLLLIQIDKTDQAKRAYLVHIDEAIITRGLKRIANQAHPKNKNQLNKHHFYINCKESDRIPSLHGHALKTSLLEHIHGDVHEYMSKKRELLEKSGYSTNTSKIGFSIKGSQMLRDLIDMSIGLKDVAQVSDVSTSIERFGLIDKSLSHTSSSAILSMPKREADKSGKLRIRTHQYGSFVEFDASLYISPFYAGANDSMHIAKLSSGPLTILFNRSFTKATFDIDFDYTKLRPFSEIVRYGRLLTILSHSDATPYFELQIDDAKVWSSPAQVTSSFSEEHGWINEDARMIQKTEVIFEQFEIDKSTPMDMLSITQAGSSISNYSTILTGKNAAFKVVFDVPPETEATRRKAMYISRLAFRIGNLGFGLVFILRGNVERDDQAELVMYSTSITIEHKLVTTLPDEEFLPKLSCIVDDVASQQDEDEYVITDPDMANDRDATE